VIRGPHIAALALLASLPAATDYTYSIGYDPGAGGLRKPYIGHLPTRGEPMSAAALSALSRKRARQRASGKRR
jgi:hypothetical protein